MVASYLEHRLRKAGGPDGRANQVFSPAAGRLLARLSRGVPRLIHTLADQAMLAAYAEAASQVKRRHVLAAATGLHGQVLELPWRFRVNWSGMLGVGLLGMLAFAAGVLTVWAIGPYVPLP